MFPSYYYFLLLVSSSNYWSVIEVLYDQFSRCFWIFLKYRLRRLLQNLSKKPIPNRSLVYIFIIHRNYYTVMVGAMVASVHFTFFKNFSVQKIKAQYLLHDVNLGLIRTVFQLYCWTNLNICVRNAKLNIYIYICVCVCVCVCAHTHLLRMKFFGWAMAHLGPWETLPLRRTLIW
jgi:cytochrome c oxidase subunit IV